ncbi:MAG: hypothetical protein HBSAPP03_05110 [Phycisphaerae bacterium]|nr:MAG: hypothetical protein HBSAPP03_05110 [Phycisphaerae bacterium]
MRSSTMSLCALFAIANAASAATVFNPSFEFGVPVMGGPLTTDWRWDTHNFVTAENGITPAAGVQMLKFLETSTGFGPGPGVVCDVFQIVDLTSPADQAIISTGFGNITVSALFNRVAGPVPSPVDTRFDINVRSHSTLANAQSLTATNFGNSMLFSDANLQTWEGLATSISLPVGTQYITIHLAAVEDVINDSTGVEFHGHYADDVRLSLVPAPGPVALAGLGGLLALRRRR